MGRQLVGANRESERDMHLSCRPEAFGHATRLLELRRRAFGAPTRRRGLVLRRAKSHKRRQPGHLVFVVVQGVRPQKGFPGNISTRKVFGYEARPRSGGRCSERLRYDRHAAHTKRLELRGGCRTRASSRRSGFLAAASYTAGPHAKNPRSQESQVKRLSGKKQQPGPDLRKILPNHHTRTYGLVSLNAFFLCVLNGWKPWSSLVFPFLDSGTSPCEGEVHPLKKNSLVASSPRQIRTLGLRIGCASMRTYGFCKV